MPANIAGGREVGQAGGRSAFARGSADLGEVGDRDHAAGQEPGSAPDLRSQGVVAADVGRDDLLDLGERERSPRSRRWATVRTVSKPPLREFEALGSLTR
jgi:hypothetical protein